MYIDSIKVKFNNIKQSTNNSMSSFGAVPLAQYSHLGESGKNILVYKLEKTDVNYLQNILGNIEKFFSKYKISDFTTKIILKDSIDAAIKLLQKQGNKTSKTKILLALSGENPCALLIGNVLKVDDKGQLHYSSRIKQAIDETELDSMVTWNNEISCKGKAILCEYLCTLLQDGFQNLYVRSEIPKYSYAGKFYETMGFRALSAKTRPIFQNGENRYIMDIFDYGNCEVLPMKATRKDIQATVTRKKTELERRPLLVSSNKILPNIDFR